MLVCNTLSAWRVVADPSALDAATWPSGATVLRIAPDDALVLSETVPSLNEEHAIVCSDRGWSGTWLTRGEFERVVAPHVEWVVDPGRLNQGLLTAVPVKILFDGDLVLLVCATPYVHELIERLG